MTVDTGSIRKIDTITINIKKISLIIIKICSTKLVVSGTPTLIRPIN